MEPALSPEQLNDPVTDHMREVEVTLRRNQTIAEALEVLRQYKPKHRIVYIYVVDDEGVLCGVVPTRELLITDADRRISEIMVGPVLSVPASASVLVACEYFILHRFLAFPVVDEQGKLLGILDVTIFTDEVFGLAEEQHGRDVFQLIGVHLARSRMAGPFSDFRDRFPWLLCNIGGGLLAAVIAGLYEDLLQFAVVLALFIPVVLALAESISIQSMSLTLRAFHEGPVKWRNVLKELQHEFYSAALLGCAAGALVGVVSWLWRGEPTASLALALSMALSMVTAALTGVALPTAVRASGRDPQIASGPIVLATADLLTLLFYFNLAGLLLDA